MPVKWIWDPVKARTNVRNHGVTFELAERVLDDPDIASRIDPNPHEERWQSVGKPSAGSDVTLLVVHTDVLVRPDGQEYGRIISARRATPHERKAYEEGQF